MRRYRAGDMVLTTGNSWLSRSIRWATRSPGEEKSRASHVAGIMAGAELIENVKIVEAVAGGVEVGRMGDRYDATTQVSVWRPKITDGQALEVAGHLAGMVGQPYPYGKLLLHLGDSLLGRAFARKRGRDPVFFRRLSLTSGRVCSGVYAQALARLGLFFGADDDRILSPDDLEDFAVSNPDKYELIRPWGPFGDA